MVGKDYELPQSLSVWEGTRFCVDDTLPKELRRQVISELVCAFLEFGLRNDIKEYIGVMLPKVWDSVFINSGWDIEFVGNVKVLDDGTIIFAGRMPVSLETLREVRKKTGVPHPVLLMEPEAKKQLKIVA